MTDLNKPVQITHNSDDGSIASIENIDEARRANANRRIWQGREIQNDMPLGPVGGVVSPYGSPENEDSECAVDSYLDEVQENAVAASQHALRTPADWLEVGRRPLTISTKVNLKDLSREVQISDDWWAEQEKFGDADLPDGAFIKKPEYSEGHRQAIRAAEAQKRERSQEWRAEASKPVAPKPSAAHFKKASVEVKKVGRSAETASKAFKKLGKELPIKPAPGANLQNRPFHNLELITLRDELRNQR